jgi:hypothetical protein
MAPGWSAVLRRHRTSKTRETIERALSPDPRDRFPSVLAFIQANESS